MSSQAEQLQHTMAFFKLEQSGTRPLTGAARRVAPAKRGPAKNGAFKLAAAATGGMEMDVDESKFSKF
jgi:hypothetical protein